MRRCWAREENRKTGRCKSDETNSVCTLDGSDIFRTYRTRFPLVTKRAKAWLEAHFGPYVQLDEVSCLD